MDEQEPLGRGYTILTFVTSAVMLAVLGVLFYQIRWLFWTFAIFTLVCVVTVILDFTIRRVTRLTYRDVGQFSTVGQTTLGQTRVFKPLGIAAPHERTLQPAMPAIPTVAEMLAKNLLDGIQMHHGYQVNQAKELVPVTGQFDDVRTFAIVGKGGVGKTVRLFFLLIQCIMGNATVYVCDPHGGVAGSITKLLAPLGSRLKIAVTDSKGDVEGQIMATVSEFTDRMERRLHDQEDDRTPCVLVMDEFTRMMYHEQYGEPCVDAIVGCANQYRKVNGYAVVLMHELVATKSRNVTNLVARLRRALHAVFIMRTDKEYASYFLSGKQVKKATQLKKGMGILINTDGEILEDVYTPKGTVADAFTVAKMLQAIDGPAPIPQLTSPGVCVSPSSMPAHLRLIRGPGERGETVQEPAEPGESLTTFTMNGESKEIASQEDKEAIFRAVSALISENKPLTREAIKQHLKWNNKKHWIVKAVCDEYGLAMP